VTTGNRSRHDFEMIQGQRLRGRVVEAAENRSVSAAHVSATVSSRPDSATHVVRSGKSNDKGEFELFVPSGICEVRTWASEQRQPHPDQQRTVEISERTETEPVVLKIGAVWSQGRVGVREMVRAVNEQPANPGPPPVRYKQVVQLQTKSNQPIGGHQTRLVYRGNSYTSEWSSHNDARFEKIFREQEAGKVGWLLIDVPGFAPAKSPEFTVGPDLEPLIVELEPASYVPIRGKAERPDGMSTKGARVRMRRIIYGKETVFLWGVEVSADAKGRFEFKQVRVGEKIMVRVELDGFEADESGPVLVDDSEPIEIPTLTLKESK